jgi:hypothetical protein
MSSKKAARKLKKAKNLEATKPLVSIPYGGPGVQYTPQK